MRPQRSLTYVECDLEFCSLTYGVAPCEAALGVTGENKCFNTRKTCQDLANFTTFSSIEAVDFEVEQFYETVDTDADGTNIGDMTAAGGLAAGFDGNSNQTAAAGAQRATVTNAYIGKTFSEPRNIGHAQIYGSNDQGFVSAINPTVTIILRGKSGTAPSSRTDGTQIGSVASFTDTANEGRTGLNGGRVCVITDKITKWDHVWFDISHNGASNNIDVGECGIYDGGDLPDGLTARWAVTNVAYTVQADTVSVGSTIALRGTYIGDMTSNGGVAASFDGTTSQAVASSSGKATTTDAYVGMYLGSGRRRIYSATIYGTNDSGFVSGANPTITLSVYGKNGSAPASSSDGTLLGTTSFTDTANESAGRAITITDQYTPWEYVWCRVQQNGAAANMFVAEVDLFEAHGGIAGAFADQELAFRRTTDAVSLVTLDVLDAAAAAEADQDVVGSYWVTAIQSGATLHGGIAARASGSSGSEKGYVAGLDDTTGTGNVFRLGKYVSGVFTSLASTSFTWAVQTRYYVRLRAQSSTIQAKVWATTDDEPADFQLEVTDTSIPAAGWMGMLGFTDNDNPAYDWFAVNIRGGSAPLAGEGDPLTLRFAIGTDYLPKQIESIPSVVDVSMTPAVVSLGKDLGQRATLSVMLKDHKHSDIGDMFDRYVTERDYNPYERGTFWGKFRARQPYLRGKPIRLIRGLLPTAVMSTTYPQGTPLDSSVLLEQETRHYVIESFDGPRPDGTYELIAKDTLKLASGDRAQAPLLSNGFLVAGITAGGLSATLTPAGIGDEEYPTSGYITIGGNEIASFTRSGNALTLVRGQLGTTASAHNTGDRVQLVLRYDAQDPADIVYDLLVNYANVDPDFINLTTWQSETATFLNQVYTANIGEPTSVETLLSEIIEQAGLVLWWSDTDQLLKLQVLRGVPSSAAVLDETSIIEGSLEVEEQPDLRLSQVWTFFGKINPLEGQDETQNYRSSAATIDTDAEAAYGVPAVKKVYSRWIAEGGRSVALALNDTLLSRYVEPPRHFKFELLRYNTEEIVLGGGYQMEFWPFQDGTGDRATVAMQVTRLDPRADRFVVEADEMLFSATDSQLEGRVVIYDANTFNVNLRTAHDQLYGDIEEGFTSPLDSPAPEVTCRIEAGVIVGSTSTSTPAFDIGDWPEGVIVNLIVNGRIQGRGGAGGDGGNAVGNNGEAGRAGGTALYTRFDINLDYENGEIWGGGGGGGGGGGAGGASGGRSGGGGGGGGAGANPGFGGGGGNGVGGGGDGGDGDDGTTESGGDWGRGATAGIDGGDGDYGGGPGNNGSAGQNGDGSGGGSGGSGGSAGRSIDGNSFITLSAPAGDLQGPTAN